MKIEDNILKHHLKNVLFISGTAYAGKSTMCGMLEKKYNLLHYRENAACSEHWTFADKEHQPNMLYQRNDWNTFFNRFPEEYQRWLYGSMEEESEFEIIDLIKMSEHQRTISDTWLTLSQLKRVADYNQVILLLAPVQVTVEKFFDREDKNDILNCINSLPDPVSTMKNFKKALAYNAEENLPEFIDSGFKYIMRTDENTLQSNLVALEKHFGLC